MSSDEERKKQFGRGVDRLSALPDSVIIHILSFLSKPSGLCITDASFQSFPLENAADVKKTALTSVLSQRWRYLWAELPVLSFQDKSRELEKISKLVGTVTRTLFIRNAKYLEKFYVEFEFSQMWAVFVDGWIAFASKSKAKVVSLLLWTDKEQYALPEMFYGNSWLTELELGHCRVAPRRRIEWRCLTRLEFLEVDMLSGCPVLCSMGLHYCLGFNRLNINSGSVGKLEVRLEKDVSRALVEISAPYVHYLHIYSAWGALVVRDIPSVVKAVIDVGNPRLKVSTLDHRSEAKEWIEATRHIPELYLTWPLFTLVSEMAADGWQIPLSYKRVSLALETSIFATVEAIILGIMRLLQSSPQLEKLEVFNPFVRKCDVLERGLRNDDFSRHLRLKTVNISCYAINKKHSPVILLLARTLLERASALEKMSILITYGTSGYSEFIKILEPVNTYPRSSDKAQVFILPIL